jgi:HPr kinase/phosphorylase
MPGDKKDGFRVLDLLDLDLKENDALNLRCIGGRPGLIRDISTTEINRPGLELGGFFENFAFQRIQIFGQGENAFLRMLERDGRNENLSRLLGYTIPCCVFTHSLSPTEDFARIAERAQCPILQTDLSTSEFTLRILRVLSDRFAPHRTVHGVLVEVFGIGVLIQGDSGVGKSETALELIERGHRLVADDAVEIRSISGNIIMGAGAKMVSHHMEIRGLGIINISHLFGVGAIRDKKQIQLVVQLEVWDASKDYDRIGAEEKTEEILGVKIPSLLIPIKPGRNIPVIIETAARNERLKKMGYDSAKEFNRNVMAWLESERTRNIFLNER